MCFGSHLYGTATPQSDRDYKAVYLPSARDILLQRVQDTVTHASDKSVRQKTAPADVDREILSLQRFLNLLAEGQTMALDMLFAPAVAMTQQPAPLWLEIQANASRLVSRRASAFLRYCRQQANKYGIKVAVVTGSIYRSRNCPPTAGRTRADCADLGAFEYHYSHLARPSFAEIIASGDAVRLKTYCYAMRTALALQWVRDRRMPPPMDVPSLVAGLRLPSDLTSEIFGLVERNATATERAAAARIMEIDDFIDHALTQPVTTARVMDRPAAIARADALFASIAAGNMTATF